MPIANCDKQAPEFLLECIVLPINGTLSLRGKTKLILDAFVGTENVLKMEVRPPLLVQASFGPLAAAPEESFALHARTMR